MIPTASVRSLVMDRDGHRCVGCLAIGDMTFQHRQATGMGGNRIRPTVVDGLAACGRCNTDFEGRRQPEALVYGWKVRRWVPRPEEVPVMYWQDRAWCRLTGEGFRVFITYAEAMEMMRRVYGADVYDEWKAAL